jgi:antitoxin StbD
MIIWLGTGTDGAQRNAPAFYCVPAKAYEELMDLVEDMTLGRIADARLADGQEPLRVSLAAL